MPTVNCGPVQMRGGGSLHVLVTIRSSKRTPSGRRAKVQKAGDSFWSDEQRWTVLEQTTEPPPVDRYFKLITDPDIGEVIRYENGRLTDHQGYGDARKKRRPK
jgi:hypothetical protein